MYFGIKKSDIIEEKEIPTSISHYGGQDNNITFDDFTFAMYEETKDLTDEQKEALLNMAKMLKKMELNKNQNLADRIINAATKYNTCAENKRIEEIFWTLVRKKIINCLFF